VALLLVLATAGPASVADRPPPAAIIDPAAALADREAAAGAADRSQRPPPDQSRPGEAPVPRADSPEQKPAPKQQPAPAKAKAKAKARAQAKAKAKAQAKAGAQAKAQQAKQAQAKRAKAKRAKAKRAKQGLPAPIGGLTRQQMKHAATIVWVGKQLGLPRQAYVVALATAMQESTMRVLASTAIRVSFSYPHDGVGSDHNSVGLFQQRPSMGWGSVWACMDPARSARAFYSALRQVPNWQGMPVTVAAQTVQVSAFPYHYAKHVWLARKLVAALT
jgi:hypothetical protein